MVGWERRYTGKIWPKKLLKIELGTWWVCYLDSASGSFCSFCVENQRRLGCYIGHHYPQMKCDAAIMKEIRIFTKKNVANMPLPVQKYSKPSNRHATGRMSYYLILIINVSINSFCLILRSSSCFYGLYIVYQFVSRNSYKNEMPLCGICWDTQQKHTPWECCHETTFFRGVFLFMKPLSNY